MITKDEMDTLLGEFGGKWGPSEKDSLIYEALSELKARRNASDSGMLLPHKAHHTCDPKRRGEFYTEAECRAWDNCIEDIIYINKVAK